MVKRPFEFDLSVFPAALEPLETGSGSKNWTRQVKLSEVLDPAPADAFAGLAEVESSVPHVDRSHRGEWTSAPAVLDWIDIPSILDAGDIPHIEACNCGSCGFKEEELTRIDSSTTAGSTTGSNAPALLGDMADFLLTGYWNTGYGDGTRSHNVTSSGTDANNGVLHYNLSATAPILTALRQSARF